MLPEILANRALKKLDPVHKQAERGEGMAGLSPMDPPEAYAPPAPGGVAMDELHPFLRGLCAEHTALGEQLRGVEALVARACDEGVNGGVRGALTGVLTALERDFVAHSRVEEAVLFPLLKARLMADGEHAKGRLPTTAVDVMLADHVKVVQLVAVVGNLLKLGRHLVDERSRAIIEDAALRQAKALVELLRLHTFREDQIVFALAHRLIAVQELDRMQAGTGRASGPYE